MLGQCRHIGVYKSKHSRPVGLEDVVDERDFCGMKRNHPERVPNTLILSDAIQGTRGRYAHLLVSAILQSPKWPLFLLFTTVSAAAQQCSISPTSVNFGSYTGSTVSPGGSPLQATCTNGSTYQILLDAGQGSGATPTVRKMTSGSSTLTYRLYQNAAHTTNWGNSSGTGYVQSTGTGSAQTFYVYPQLTANQLVPPGTYSDTISVTTNYSGTATFTVTAMVTANCTISAGALAFGNYVPQSQTLTTAALTVTCTNTTTYNVGLDGGIGSQSSGYTRYMTGPGSSQIPYHMFSDSGRSTDWGNTVGTDTVAGTGTGSAQTMTVYGTIYTSHYATPGTYTDTVTATITY